MYNEQLLVYLSKAVARPLWPEGTKQVFSSEVGAKDSGIWFKLWCHIEDNIIHEVRYRVIGSGYLIATVEWANAFLTGENLNTAEALDAKIIVEALALPPQRFYCAQMIVDAVTKIARQAI